MAEKIEHKWHNPCTRDDDAHNAGCMWCDGGLEVCSVCGAFEGATPDDCPNVRLQPDETDAIYKGLRNFRDGKWHDECCQVMRHIYDKDNLMMEQGYFQNEHGHWEKYPVAEWVKVL
jgi:hypothetical protein